MLTIGPATAAEQDVPRLSSRKTETVYTLNPDNPLEISF